jgi:putative tricarboxylic transport membrane protein
LIIIITAIGSYSVNNNVLDVFCMLAMGIFGYELRKFGFELAPLALALILGPPLEVSFRQSLVLSHGSLSIFVARPISGGLLGVFAAVVIGLFFWQIWSNSSLAAAKKSQHSS